MKHILTKKASHLPHKVCWKGAAKITQEFSQQTMENSKKETVSLYPSKVKG